jgi:hypothetical protein
MQVTIYYKDIPFALNEHVVGDKQFTLTKEGIYSRNNINCLRAVITLEQSCPNNDKKKFDKLLKLLEVLASNQEIFSFTPVG